MPTPLVLDTPAASGTPGAGRSVTRAVVAALVTGCLALAGVIGIGWYASSGLRAATSASNTQPYIVPSAAWASGAQQVWELRVADDAEVLTAGGRLITIERDAQSDTSATLTGYQVSESGATRAWSTTADLTHGITAGAQFQLWAGSTLVHGTTLIDLKTGAVSTAPWSQTETALVVDDRVITCADSHPCRAWAPGVETPVWTVPVTDGVTPLTQRTSRVPVLHRSSRRYAVLDGHTVVNIDTGASVTLELPSLQSWTVLSTAEGWAVVSGVSEGHSGYVYEFDVDGGAPVDTYSITSPIEDGQVALLGPEPRTRQDLRTLLTGDRSSALGWATRESTASSCIVSARRGDGPTIDVPTATAVRGDAITASSFCAEEIIVSPDHHLVAVQTQSRLTEHAFALLYDGATGTRIDFPGTDPLAGDTSSYSLVTEDLVVGYDAASGLVHGYTPGGHR